MTYVQARPAVDGLHLLPSRIAWEEAILVWLISAHANPRIGVVPLGPNCFAGHDVTLTSPQDNASRDVTGRDVPDIGDVTGTRGRASVAFARDPRQQMPDLRKVVRTVMRKGSNVLYDGQLI